MRVSVSESTIIACCDHKPSDVEWQAAFTAAGLADERLPEPAVSQQGGLWIYEYVRQPALCSDLHAVQAAS